jgi:5-(carboxyamino)imidazole ribonucleotide synthase
MKKIGILGGGQLGRMLLQAAANYPVETHVLENDPECPAAHLCHTFTRGDIRSYGDVYAFGKQVDILTIEVEQVNTDALVKLEQEGVEVIPSPTAISTLNNKIRQKEFYRTHQIPSPDFIITQNREALGQHLSFLPAVHKLGTGGYDGRGVQVLRGPGDLSQGFDQPSVLEKKVDIAREIAILVAAGRDGNPTLYPPVDMVFDKTLNQLDYQLCPAELDQKTGWTIEALALAVVKALKSPGIFAVELFIDRAGTVWVNETAPRVHNSGHHTIEASYCSQFDMLWRILLGYPLGNTESIMPSATINIIGAPDETGAARYEGLEELLKVGNAFFHLYGKKETRPGRKMGHATVLSNEKQELLHQINKIRHGLRVTGSGQKD